MNPFVNPNASNNDINHFRCNVDLSLLPPTNIASIQIKSFFRFSRFLYALVTMKPKTKYSEHETAVEHSCCESIFFSNNYNSKFSFVSIFNNVSTSQFSSGGFTYKINEIIKRVSQGFWGTREHWQNIEGNKGTLANFWEQGNKIRKITVRIRKMCGNMGT